VETDAVGVARSKSEFDDEGVTPAGGDVGGGEVLKRFMISDAADWRAAGAGAEDDGSGSPDPKISARRSWVEGPLSETPLTGVGADESSPIRSTTVSLSVRVEPTGFLSLTAKYQHASSSPTVLTSSHHGSSDLRRRHSL